jgi:hypothetical protein
VKKIKLSSSDFETLFFLKTSTAGRSIIKFGVSVNISFLIIARLWKKIDAEHKTGEKISLEFRA